MADNNAVNVEQQQELALAEARMRQAQAASDAGDVTLSQRLGGAPPTTTQRILASQPVRFMAGMARPVEGLAQLAAHGAAAAGSALPSWLQTGLLDRVASGADSLLSGQKKTMDDAYTATGLHGTDYAGGLGTVASPINYMLPELKWAQKGMPLVKRAAAGLATGTGLGLMEPVDNITPDNSYAKQKMEQGALGAAGGIAAPIIGAGLKGIAVPNLAPDVRALLARGIRLTPGEILGGGYKATEDKLSSYPLAGSFVAGAQGRALDDFNRAVGDDALSHIGQQVPNGVSVGRKMVAHVEKSIGNVYDSVLPKMTGTIDAPLIKDFQDVITAAKSRGANKDTLDALNNIIEGQFTNRPSTASGYFDGDTLKLIQSDLGKIGSSFSKSDNANDQILGNGVQDLHSAFNDMLARTNPEYTDTLNGANAAWAKFARMRTASSRVGAKNGKFTPAQFANAVRGGDNSVQKGAYARGNALMQKDLSDPALEVLSQKYPDSGTAGRLGLIGALTGAAAIPHVGLPAALVGAGLSALYTRPGQALFRGAVSHQPWNRLGDFATSAGSLGSGPLASVLAAPSAAPAIEGSN
jgi:hypothetical protein